MNGIRTPAHILRVNHAGERGAIGIYRGQLAVARMFMPSCVAPLTSMLAHERSHFATFDRLLVARGLRHCHALPLWALGGWVLGLFTAVLGQRAIWVCTAAIENTVNAHLEHQVAFLRGTDLEVLQAVESIRQDEESHEAHATANGGNATGPYRILWWVVVGSTSFAIWLSTKL